MRTYTIALSIVTHAIAVCALLIAPLLATDTLPEPRTATEFIQVVALPEPPQPPPARVTRPAAAVPRPDVAPLTVPEGISPEPPEQPRFDPAPVDNGVIAFGDSGVALEEPAPPPPAPPSPVRVGGDIRPPQKIFNVPPEYPAVARAAHVSGVVILEAVIGEDGLVRDVRVLRSIALLDAAAVEAVRQWRFKPTLLNGEPVPVVMTITVNFQLQ